MGRHSRRGSAPAAKGEAEGERAGRGNRAAQEPPGVRERGPARRADGAPARGVARPADGTPAGGVPRFADGTPARGVPRFPDGTPARGVPQVRGGHPEQREPGGAWGELRAQGGNGRAPSAGRGPSYGPSAGRGPSAGPGPAIPRQRQEPRFGPRQDYLDAFDEAEDGDVFARRSAVSAHAADPYPSVAERAPRTGVGVPSDTDGDEDDAPPTGVPAQNTGSKGRTFTGIAAAAVTTVLAVVVAGQVTHGRDDTAVSTQSATEKARDVRSTPSAAPSVATLTYEQAMGRKYPLGATLRGPGKFDAVPGTDRAPGKGRKYTYRVDVERGLGLDGALFAEAVQKTLNDDRSWAHDGARTFERVDSGKPDFVITLASPGTTATWCAKSGLDTTEDNVSCDSASTDRVMINAYRWAQGSKTYGDRIHAYRQMLINHEVGHRLGYGHVTCSKNGQPAPVMQQQTKFLDHDGIHCLPNPWPYPGS
ncbi:DUF3152 domain-containing protein [Streptomyces gilvifuscus]|uniref:DUF3152 domain-containing protein n=1 Tax=Streptomyces gilvifuscus TaxID=1550617 RepID=A0ABT5G0V6_9ACTN|nr:DUF3152 domain-containing protein [Streptomyces gilvifuscus]MDC2958360.1 DUF3152 domain-containing protein [Streptomyces gilvifuscus]